MILVNPEPADHADRPRDAVDVSADGVSSQNATGGSRLRPTLALGGRSRPKRPAGGAEPMVHVASDDSRSAAPALAMPPTQPTPLKRLTAGRKELAITHAGATYMLRVTKANKLILTKDADDNSTV